MIRERYVCRLAERRYADKGQRDGVAAGARYAIYRDLKTDRVPPVNFAEAIVVSVKALQDILALGERRASAVRDYLVSRGINASRLNTLSYGEERPKADNSKEETRRLNRRAVLAVNIQKD